MWTSVNLDARDWEKRANEIGAAIPSLKRCPISPALPPPPMPGSPSVFSPIISSLAAPTSLFTVKGNQPNLHDDIRLPFDESTAQRALDFAAESAKPLHGRRERLSIRVSGELHGYLVVPLGNFTPLSLVISSS